MDRHIKTKKTGKARIPDHLRRRALVSCDRCKKRRIRCSRSSNSDANEPCQSCLEVGVNCESTLPRKTRIYGSVETLSVRYRVLDALIKGLYPHKDTNSIEALYAIAEAHEITLPIFDEQTVAEEVFNHGSKVAVSPQASVGSGDSPSVTSESYQPSSTSERKPSVVLEEKLVPMPRGPSHYIGPSSSFGFVLTVRNMVAEFNAALNNIQQDDERAKLSNEFAESNWSKALEPITKDESDESSEDTVDNRQVDITGRAPNRKRKASLFPGSADSAALSDRQKKITVLSLLPSKEVSDTFIEAYFQQVHLNYLLFHRPSFQARYEDMWSDPSILMKDIEPGWICTVFMMMVFGAQALEDRDMKQSRQIQKHYLDLVQARMHQLISSATLINVQALLLLQLYQHNNTERNSAFMLLGCASRMAMALGMHREGTSGEFNAIEREVRKRVWWTAYIFEQNQCVILGRPCAIDDMEVNVGYPDEVKLDGATSVPPGYIEYFTRLIKLMSDIRKRIYAAPSSATQQGESPKISLAIQFLLDLDSWHNSLPTSLRVECPQPVPNHRRAVTLLHIFFHHTQALVTRPFILKKVGVQLARKLGRHVRSQDLDKEEISLSHACGTFSQKSAVLLHQLLANGQFDGVAWVDGYFVYHSIFILALDFLARPWDQQDTADDATRRKAVRDVMTLLHPVKLCSTFVVLTQVALQLSRIVGIFDPASTLPHEKTEEFRQYMEQQQNVYSLQQGLPQPIGLGGAGMNVVDNWFQKEPVDLPWDLKDFFGGDGAFIPHAVGGFVGGPPMTLAGFGAGMVTLAPEDDLSLAVPNHTAYTQWGAIETPFATQGRAPAMPPGMLPKSSGGL